MNDIQSSTYLIILYIYVKLCDIYINAKCKVKWALTIYIYIYIYIERERERELYDDIHLYTCNSECKSSPLTDERS